MRDDFPLNAAAAYLTAKKSFQCAEFDSAWQEISSASLVQRPEEDETMERDEAVARHEEKAGLSDKNSEENGSDDEWKGGWRGRRRKEG